MILAFEMTWRGTDHAPGNSATLQTLALAYPTEEIRVFAHESHLAELQRYSALATHRTIRYFPAATSDLYQGKTHVVSPQRLAREAAILFRAIHAAPGGEACLIVLLSATPTAIFAASWAVRLFVGRRLGVHVGLHGNLNELTGWRSRNPMVRGFDLPAALTARHPASLRFLVLEDCILEELRRVCPGAAERTDVLPLAVNVAEIPPERPIDLSPPIRIGFVGQATKAKGIDVYLTLAAEFKARYGDRVSFHLIGRIREEADPADYAILADPVSTSHLSRADFAERLGRMHYVMLPYREGYYNLSASGALIDAITSLKPVIATSLPLVRHFQDRFGEIGLVRDGEEGLREALVAAIDGFDANRYARHMEALRRARESRLPEALANQYRTIVTAKLADLLRPGTSRTAPSPAASP